MEHIIDSFERTWLFFCSTLVWAWSFTQPSWIALGESSYLDTIYQYFYTIQKSPTLFCLAFVLLIFLTSFFYRVSKSCSGDSSFLLNSIRNLSGLSFLVLFSVVICLPFSLVVVYETLEPLFSNMRVPPNYLTALGDFFTFIFDWLWYVLGAAFFASWCAKYFVSKKIEPWLNKLVVKGSTKNFRDTHQASNVDNVENFMPKAKAFKPQKYFQKAAKERFIFFGLDASNESVFVPLNKFRSSNLQINI